MSIDAREDVDQVNRMVDNLLELADEALEDDSILDPEQVKDMASQIKELLSALFDKNIEDWGDEGGDEGGYFDSDEV